LFIVARRQLASTTRTRQPKDFDWGKVHVGGQLPRCYPLAPPICTVSVNASQTESPTYDFNVFVFIEQQILHLEITTVTRKSVTTVSAASQDVTHKITAIITGVKEFTPLTNYTN